MRLSGTVCQLAYSSLVDQDALEKEQLPRINVIAKGIEQKIIKNVDMHILSAFPFDPASRLANPRLCHGLGCHQDVNISQYLATR